MSFTTVPMASSMYTAGYPVSCQYSIQHMLLSNLVRSRFGW